MQIDVSILLKQLKKERDRLDEIIWCIEELLKDAQEKQRLPKKPCAKESKLIGVKDDSI